MDGTMEVTNPDEVMFSLTLTASLGEWMKLREQLETGKWPSTVLRDLIRDMGYQANTKFRPTQEA